ncbi:MAG: hypothetical protein ACRCWM_11250, partial [Sarcina sp.]
MIDKIMILSIFLMPYVLLGENTSNILMWTGGLIYIFLNRKKNIKFNSKIVSMLSLLTISIVISNLVINNTIFSYSALVIYINL